MRKGPIAVGALLLLVALVAALLLHAATDVTPAAAPSHVGTHVEADATPDRAAADSNDEPHRAPRVRAGAAKHDEAAPGADASAVLEGVVLGEDGSGLPGATVRAAARAPLPGADDDPRRKGVIDAAWPARWDVEVVTGDDGAFRFDARRGRPWLVAATKDGCGSDAVRATPGQDGPLTLVVVASPEWSLRVLDERGGPVAGAEVLVFNARYVGPPIARAVADDDGRARVRCLEGESLLVRAAGFAAARVTANEVLGDVVLVPGLAVAGTVVEADGRPVADATVLLTHDAPPMERTTTSSSGAFRFDALSALERPGGFGVLVVAPDHVETSRTICAGVEDARIVLSRTGRVEGVVVAEDGAPVPRAIVTDGIARTVAATDGRFALDVVCGRRRLRAQVESEPGPWPHRPFIAEGEVGVDVPDERPVTGVRIVAATIPVSYLTVRVVDPDAATAHGRLWAYVAMDGVSEEGALVGLDGTAVFEIAAPPGTSVRARATAPLAFGRFTVGSDVVVSQTAANAVAAVATVTLRRAVPVEFKLTGGDPPVGPDGRAVPDRFWFRGEDGGLWSVRQASAFRADPAVPLHVGIGSGGQPTAWVDLDPPGDEGRVYEIPRRRGATVRARVAAPDGGPLPDAHVILAHGAWDARPDGGGNVAIAGVSAGRHRLEVRAGRGELRGAWDIEVPGEGDVDLGEIRAWAEADVRGRVTGADGRPVPGASVVARGAGAEVRARGATRADGTFSVPVPAGPEVEVDVIRPPFARWGTTLVVPVEGADLAVRLDRGGSVRALLDEPEWASGGTILARVGDGPRWTPPGGERGGGLAHDVLLEGLPAGEVRLTLVFGDVEIERTAMVRVGETTDVAFSRP